LLLAGNLACAPAVDEHIAPDTVLINGAILTVDPEDSIAEALAIRGGKVIAVGTNNAIEKLIGPGTQIVDLDGATATPGLIDSHCHFSGAEMLYSLDLSYPSVKSIADVVEKVKAQVETLGPDEWIRGDGWDEGKLSELRYIVASDLDPVSQENPVWLGHTMGHYGVANSVALKLANITKETPDPPGGTIDRKPDGTPTGVLKESAQRLVGRLVPSLSPEQEQKGILKIIEEFNREGMTAVKDPGVGKDKWGLYQNILADNKLNVRVFALWNVGKTIESAEVLIDRVGSFTRPYISTGNDRLVSGGIKMYLDGSGGARTAWLYEDWSKDYENTDVGNRGYPVLDPDIYREQVRLFHNAGLHVSTHAIGDRAIDWTLDSYALALQEKPTSGLRHGIIHCNIPTDEAIAKMANMQKEHDAGYPESQSTFTWWIGDTYAGNFGPKRSQKLMPFKTYLEKGVLWAGGSDFSVTPHPARYGLWASISRRPLQGSYGSDPFGTEESIDIHNALRSYTVWAARQLFLEDKIGTLEVGKYADIAVWDKNLYAVTTEEIKDLKCQMTFLGGEIVYQALDSTVHLSNSR
jgi:predicted amidohydrolase YtcJ